MTAEEPSVVLRRFPFSKSRETNGADHDSAEEDDYENIDAHLDADEREGMRRSDYINWVYMDSDGEDGEGVRPISDRNAPSIKLDRHPALKKSQSSHNFESDSPSLTEAMALKKQFQQHLQNLKSNQEGFRPKNRAPPPPPGGRLKRERDRDKEQHQQQQPSGNKGMSNGTKSRHKRSQSDVHISNYSESDTADESTAKKSPKLGLPQGPRRSPLLLGKRQHRPSPELSGATGSGAPGGHSTSGGQFASNTPPSGRSPLAHRPRPHHPHGPPGE